MVRPKARIPRILAKLSKYWEENQDQRLGQLLCQISNEIKGKTDPFYLEDNKLERFLDIRVEHPVNYEDRDVDIYLKETFNLDSVEELKEKLPYVMKWLLNNNDLRIMSDNGDGTFSYVDLNATLQDAFNKLEEKPNDNDRS